MLRQYEPFEIPEDVNDYLRGECGILCFYPNGANIRPQSSQEPPYVRFAIPAASLPKEFGLDWSYERRLIQRGRDENPDAPLIDLCLQVIKELGSIASYTPVAADQLYVCSMGSDPGDPTHWPTILDTPDDRVWRYGIGA